MASWIDLLRQAQKTCFIQDGKRKIHYKFPGNEEMAEDYDLKSNVLLVRQWKKKSTLGGTGKWELEVGEVTDPRTTRSLEVDGIIESNTNPIFIRKDTKAAFQWRIRNLPYSLPTYSVTVDTQNRIVIIRTTNKKYYKTFRIPDLDRLKLPLEQESITLSHSNNTLVISYVKPTAVLDLEKQLLQEMAKMKASKEGDVECNPS